MAKTKNKKQEEIDTNFSFDNIKNAKDLIKKAVPNKEKEDSKILFFFRVNFEYKKKFNALRMERSDFLGNYDENNMDTFNLMVLFIKEVFQNNNMYEVAPDSFKHNVTRRGKRKKNNRTVPKEETENIQLYLSSTIDDIYLNCFYSFIKDNPEENIYNDFYSRNYFFFDVMDIIERNKQEFFKFKKVN